MRDAERSKPIEINERGFAQAFAEVGTWIAEFHDTVSMGSNALAFYYCEKIADAINAGLMLRPG